MSEMIRRASGSVLGVAFLFVLAAGASASIIVKVAPEGDGMGGQDRWGGPWQAAAFDQSANPNWAYYDGYTTGSDHYYNSRNVFMQVSLDGLPAAGMIENATLNIHVVQSSAGGAYLYHKLDASSATGLASQQILGDRLVRQVGGAAPGWLAIDVTDFIKSDLSRDHNWAAFSFNKINFQSLKFASGEDAVYAPYLSVTAVPEPAALGLLGLSGLALLRRRS